MSFFSTWKALTNFDIRGRYLFFAVAFEEYFPVLHDGTVERRECGRR